MSPTVVLFFKLAILITLSLQVCGFESYSSAESHGRVEDELDGVPLMRRQLERAPGSETQQKDPAKKVSKEEELAEKMFATISQMGNDLEAVTSLSSTTNEILENSKKVQGLVTQLSTFAKDLVSGVPEKANQLNKSLGSITNASGSLTKSLKVIDQKPDDANLIKENYKTLEKSFQTILTALDDLAIATVPRIAELVKKEQQQQQLDPDGRN